MQFNCTVSSHRPRQGAPECSPAASHLCGCSLTQNSRTDPLPPYIYLPPTDNDSKGIISLQTNRTAAHQVSAVSQRAKTEGKHTPPRRANKQKNPKQPTCFFPLLCGFPFFSVQCKHSMAEVLQLPCTWRLRNSVLGPPSYSRARMGCQDAEHHQLCEIHCCIPVLRQKPL